LIPVLITGALIRLKQFLPDKSNVQRLPHLRHRVVKFLLVSNNQRRKDCRSGRYSVFSDIDILSMHYSLRNTAYDELVWLCIFSQKIIFWKMSVRNQISGQFKEESNNEEMEERRREERKTSGKK
jgi:hypothetical protein